jgi:steroid 5-alpha reductase family enzyme
MTWLLARGSGKPTLERDIAERRPDYASYIERTSGFIPLPPRSRDQPRRAGGRAGAAGSG